MTEPKSVMGHLKAVMTSLMEAHEFQAITTVQAILSKSTSYDMRGYVYNDFPDDLAEAVRNVFGVSYVHAAGGRIQLMPAKIRTIRPSEVKLREFHDHLGKTVGSTDSFSALKAVECTILDLEAIALPLCARIKAVEAVARAYAPMIRNTADAIIPFVAVERQLRGKKDPEYKRHYLELVKWVGGKGALLRTWRLAS